MAPATSGTTTASIPSTSTARANFVPVEDDDVGAEASRTSTSPWHFRTSDASTRTPGSAAPSPACDDAINRGDELVGEDPCRHTRELPNQLPRVESLAWVTRSTAVARETYPIIPPSFSHHG